MVNAPDHQAGTVDYGDLGWLLTSFSHRLPSIAYALAVSVVGLLLAASEEVPGDLADQLAAITSGLASLTTGPVRQSVIDMDGGVLLVMAVADRAHVAVLAEPGADLGQIGYETAVLAQRVATALEPGARTEQA